MDQSQDWGSILSGLLNSGVSAYGSPNITGSSFPWASMLSAILPGIGSLFGNPLTQSLNQLQGSESSIGTQLQSIVAGLNNDFSQFYQPAMGAESASVIGDLGATAGNIPLSDQVYAQMAKTGLSPQVQENAMSQLGQAYQQSLSSLNQNAAPGSNLLAARTAAQNSYLTSATNQSAQLAATSQQMKAQGAQGLASNAFNALQAANAFTGQGINLENVATTGLSNLYQDLAYQAAQYAQASGAGSGGLGSGLGSIFGTIMSFM